MTAPRWDSDKRFVVIAIANGDGSVDYGARIFSEEFRTRKAAEAAREMLAECGTVYSVLVIED